MNIRMDTIFERDIDLLIMEEFISSYDFAEIFLNMVGIHAPYCIEEVIHSKTDAEYGESDLVVVLSIGGKRHAIHIEDKIDAIAMPNQSGRYDLRAKKDISNGEYDDYSVFIVAPEKYLSANEEAQKYKNRISYEQLYDYFRNCEDIRSQYKQALIGRAIFEQGNGYQWKANPGVVEFCNALNAYQAICYPSLPAGSIAWWSHRNTPLARVVLVHKAINGYCDLCFRNHTTEKLLARVQEHLSNRMMIVQTGKSASVRIIVPPISFEEPFATKIEEVDVVLDALNELYSLAKSLAGSKSSS